MPRGNRPGRRLREGRTAARLAGAAAVAGILLAVLALTASAHATLLFTSPADGSAVPAAPAVITLTFNENVSFSGTPVTLADAGGRREGLGVPRLSQGRSLVTVPVAERLPDGVYTVTWQVISADGDLVGSQFRFAVGPAPATLASTAAAAPSSPGQWPTALLRWLLFAGLAVALGGLAGRALGAWFRGGADGTPAGTARGPLPAPWALGGSLLGAAASAGLAVLDLGSGSLAAGLEHFSVPRLVSGSAGVIIAVEFAAFACAAVLARLRRPAWAAVPLLAVVVAEGLRAHPEDVVPAGGALLTWAHLLAAALWAGMLLYVVRAAVAWRASPAAVHGLVKAYARVAAGLFVLVVGTGVIEALLLVPLADLFTTDYGRVLVIKAALVGTAAALAVAGRLWLRRTPAAGAGPARVTRIEAGTLAAVLAAAAALTTFAAPSLATSGGSLPFPPPASGPVVPLGGLAGEVSIYAAASAGQLVLTLSAPEENGAAHPQYTASVTLTAPGGRAKAVQLRGCGPGCFVAPVNWARGDNLLTIRAAASGWAGGTASLDVPWPPAPGTTALSRTLALLRKVPAMTVYERVTSDTAGSSGSADHIPVSGARFLSVEPYASGVAPFADLADEAGGEHLLLLGFPGDSIAVALTLDASGKIIRETLTDPGHLITRGFAYPEK
jgi:copper transport protein